VSTFGGTTKQYHAEIDQQAIAIQRDTATDYYRHHFEAIRMRGGNYLEIGEAWEHVNVRGVGCCDGINEMGAVLMAEHNGVPVYLRDVADVKGRFQPPLGRVGGTAVEHREGDGPAARGRAVAARAEGRAQRRSRR
jgi:cobalt-zinc-cadmium resistance protein CzcA